MIPLLAAIALSGQSATATNSTPQGCSDMPLYSAKEGYPIIMNLEALQQKISLRDLGKGISEFDGAIAGSLIVQNGSNWFVGSSLITGGTVVGRDVNLTLGGGDSTPAEVIEILRNAGVQTVVMDPEGAMAPWGIVGSDHVVLWAVPKMIANISRGALAAFQTSPEEWRNLAAAIGPLHFSSYSSKTPSLTEPLWPSRAGAFTIADLDITNVVVKRQEGLSLIDMGFEGFGLITIRKMLLGIQEGQLFLITHLSPASEENPSWKFTGKQLLGSGITIGVPPKPPRELRDSISPATQYLAFVRGKELSRLCLIFPDEKMVASITPDSWDGVQKLTQLMSDSLQTQILKRRLSDLLKEWTGQENIPQ